MRDRGINPILRRFSFLNCLVDDVKNEVDLIRIGSKKSNFFVVAPNMRYILEIIKYVCLFWRSHEYQLHFIVGMKGDDIQNGLIKNSTDIFLTPDNTNRMVSANIKGQRHIAQNTVFL